MDRFFSGQDDPSDTPSRASTRSAHAQGNAGLHEVRERERETSFCLTLSRSLVWSLSLTRTRTRTRTRARISGVAMLPRATRSTSGLS